MKHLIFQSRLVVLLLGFLTIGISQVWGVDVSLTQEEIKKATATGYSSSASVSSSSGTWTGYMLVNINSGYLQINKNANSYQITTPEFTGGITSMTIHTCNSTASGRTFYLCNSSDKGSLTSVPETGCYGSGSTSASNGDVTISVTGNPKQLYIYSNGAAYVSGIDVTYGSSTPATITYHIGSTSGTVESMVGVSLSTALKDVATTSCDNYSTTFMGWSTAAINGKLQTAPTSLLDADATITEDMEVWAVWAHATITPAGETETIWSETFGDAGNSSTKDVSTYTGFSGKTTGISYTASSAKVSKNASNTCTLSGSSGKSNLFSTTGGTAGTFTVSGINTKGYENLVLNFNFKYASTSGKSLSVSANSTSLSVSSTNTTNWQAITCNSGIPSVNSLTLVFSGKSNGQVYFDDIILTGNTPASAIYSDYLTTCCTSWTAPTLTYTASASIGEKLNPSWGAGTTYGTLTYSSSDEDVLEVNATSGVVTTKAAGTAHVIASWSSVDDYCDNSTTSNEITVTAAYNITYKDKGGVDFSGTHEDGYPQTHTYGTATPLKGASKDYYNFNGWFANESCTGNAIQTVAADAYTANFTLYAKWTPIEYNITYTLNGGTNASGNPAKYTYETATITLQDPSKTGHDFQGWFKESTFENQVTTIAKGSHGNVDLYANWSVKSYTLTWDLNGGSVKTAGTTAGSVAFGTALTAPTVERTGYDFTGWKKGGVSIDFTKTVTMPAENATYVAQWIAEQYDINYKDENNAEFTGSMSGLPTTHTYDTPTPLVNSSKTGYNFIGWFTDPACTSSISTLGATDYLDAITLYAKWSEIMPTGITLSPNVTEITDLIYNGSSNEQKTTITATVEPSTAFNTAFEWSVVEGADVVEVADDGTITAHKAGSAKVKVASTRVPTIYKEISVTVHALPQITWKNMDGSTFTTSNGTSAGKVGSLPANKPTSCDTEKYPYFRGWSATDFGKTTTNPENGFVTKDTEVALDGVYTYYAVFSSKVASLNFGTPAVSDDFESCTEQTITTKHNPAATISNCGIFTYCYNNNTSNAYGVQSDTYGKYLHVKGSNSPLSLSYQHSSNFSTTGVWSVKINKAANCDFGFYSEGASATAWSNANARVYMRYANGAISVGSGSSMASTGYTYYGDADVVEITMIYNATSNATTYGDGIALGAGKAHVYVNGDPIMNGDAPKEMTIVKTATKYFRIASTSTTVAKFYDVNIYNSLPTLTSIEGCEWATQCCTPYSITLENKGTVTGGTFSTTPSQACEGAEVTISNTPETGYSFVKYTFTKTEDGQEIDPDDLTFIGEEFLMPNYDITIAATFTNQYTITFDNQEATTAGIESTTATYGQAMPSIAGNLPEKTNYNFGGYFDAEEGTGTQYYNADGTSAKNWDKTNATTLYAYWLPITSRTISYLGDEHLTYSEKPISVDGAVQEELTIEYTVNSGYEIKGVTVKVGETTLTNNEITYDETKLYIRPEAGFNANVIITFNIDLIHATEITLSETSAEIMQGKSLQLTATVLPDVVLNKEVTWTSSDASGKISVNADGLVSVARDAEKDATATITATSVDNNQVYASCTITVLENANWYGLYDKTGAEMEDGEYIIYYDGNVLKNALSDSRIANTSGITPVEHIISIDDDALVASIVWEIKRSGDYWTIYNASVEKYAAGTGTKSEATLLDAADSEGKVLWTITKTDDAKNETYDIKNKKNEDSDVNAYLRYNSSGATSYWACYAYGQAGPVSLYKKGYKPKAALVSIALEGTLSKTEYIAGDKVSIAGLTVMGGYNDGTSAAVAFDDIQWSFEPETLTESTSSVSITATVGELTDTKSYDVNVSAIPQEHVYGYFNFTTSGADITDWNDNTKWSTSYTEHTITADEAEVIFEGANKSATTITTMPIVKGSAIILQLKESNKQLTSAAMATQQWSDKKQDLSIEVSRDNTNWIKLDAAGTETTGISAAINKNDIRFVKFLFSSNSNQIGIVSISFTTSDIQYDYVRTDLVVGNYGTMCVPYAVKATDRSGATFWNIETSSTPGYTNPTSVTIVEETGDLEAGKPYIFCATETEMAMFFSGDIYDGVAYGSDYPHYNGLYGNLTDAVYTINANANPQPTDEPTRGYFFVLQQKLYECGWNCTVRPNRGWVQAAEIEDKTPEMPVSAPRRTIGHPNVAPTRIDNLSDEGWIELNGAHKYFRNGTIIIVNEGNLYNAQGIKIQ